MAKWDVTEEPFEILDDRFLDEIGVRPKQTVQPTPPEKVDSVRTPTNNDWYKQGKECPF